MKKYYEKQSSGRYSVEGEVSDWVKVDYNEARYGSNYCGTPTAPTSGTRSRTASPPGSPTRRPAGPYRRARSRRTLAEYDQWDRYDFDGDGNFNESDGYIDHFQIVHAGEDESAGGGAAGRRTPSGPTAGTRTAPTPARPARRATSSAAPRSATPASGSATTPSSPRTAASASSPTSTATTSVCPTTTTPRAAARTPPASGR